MFTKDDYSRELKAKQERLAGKLAERERLDREIAELRQDIGSLAQLAGRTKTPPGILASMGLTDSCREVLLAVNEPLTVAEVRDGLERIGFDTVPYSNVLASIQTTLKRMDDVEESEKDGKKAYKIKVKTGFMALLELTQAQ